MYDTYSTILALLTIRYLHYSITIHNTVPVLTLLTERYQQYLQHKYPYTRTHALFQSLIITYVYKHLVLSTESKSKFLYTTSLPTQHHSFFRNYPLHSFPTYVVKSFLYWTGYIHRPNKPHFFIAGYFYCRIIETRGSIKSMVAS